MRPPLAETAFNFDGRDLATGQVVLAALRWGEWADLEREVRTGLVGVQRMERDGTSVADTELRPILIAWRRERNLLSAEDYQTWLADRGLTLEDMSGYLRRSAVARLTTDGACDRAELVAAVYPEAILAGRLSAWAQRLAQHEAARRALRALGAETPRMPAEDVSQLVAAAKHADASGLDEIPVERLRVWGNEVLELEHASSLLVDQLAHDEPIERCLSAHSLDWQRFEWEEATFAREDVAREAGLWVREEGLELSAVAEQADTVLTVGAAYGYEAREIAGMLTGKRPGELVGPVATDSGWRLVLLRERVLPSAADPQLRVRAIDELLEDALAPHLAGRVEWHARF
jgi:hypothetical protein